jgi:hypothetical protein
VVLLPVPALAEDDDDPQDVGIYAPRSGWTVQVGGGPSTEAMVDAERVWMASLGWGRYKAQTRFGSLAGYELRVNAGSIGRFYLDTAFGLDVGLLRAFTGAEGRNDQRLSFLFGVGMSSFHAMYLYVGARAVVTLFAGLGAEASWQLRRGPGEGQTTRVEHRVSGQVVVASRVGLGLEAWFGSEEAYDDVDPKVTGTKATGQVVLGTLSFRWD